MGIIAPSGKREIWTLANVFALPDGLAAPYVVAMMNLDQCPWTMGNVEGGDSNSVAMDLVGCRTSVVAHWCQRTKSLSVNG